jgi:hypothetical protein
MPPVGCAWDLHTGPHDQKAPPHFPHNPLHENTPIVRQAKAINLVPRGDGAHDHWCTWAQADTVVGCE